MLVQFDVYVQGLILSEGFRLSLDVTPFFPSLCWLEVVSIGKARDVNLAVGKMSTTMSNKYS